MRIALLVVSGFALTVGAVDADQFRDYFGAADSTLTEPVSGVALSLAVQVEKVDSGGAAEQAGMQVGDRILASSGCRVYGLSEMSFMRHTEVGLPIRFVVQREGKILEISAAGARPRTIGFNYITSAGNVVMMHSERPGRE